MDKSAGKVGVSPSGQVKMTENEINKQLAGRCIARMNSSHVKVVVFGSFHSGKSTFIQAIDPASRHIQAEGAEGNTTISIDFGRAEVFGRQVHLFGTPGQERFDFVREITENGMDVAILMVDSSSPVDGFTLDLYRHLTGTGVPVGIMLNKCDLGNSQPQMIREKFRHTRTFELSSLNPESARRALEEFLEVVIGKNKA
jgi:small GTP-binding protein